MGRWVDEYKNNGLGKKLKGKKISFWKTRDTCARKDVSCKLSLSKFQPYFNTCCSRVMRIESYGHEKQDRGNRICFTGPVQLARDAASYFWDRPSHVPGGSNGQCSANDCCPLRPQASDPHVLPAQPAFLHWHLSDNHHCPPDAGAHTVCEQNHLL